jgi:BirA family biotin operon repressor/biotin-[acetyl-CoA-carboxylase] ligase
MYYLREVDSTNRIAKELARRGERAGTVVVTDFQTAGRGRGDRRWQSPPGSNLLFSLILRPRRPVGGLLPLTLAFSLAIAELLTDVLGTEVSVKWPNDVVTDAGKICGILSESSTKAGEAIFVIVGIGINVNMRPQQFPRDTAVASCLSLTGTEHDRGTLLAGVLDRLERMSDAFFETGFEGLVKRYAARLWLMGKKVAFSRKRRLSAGEVVGVQDDGGLVVRIADGSVTLYDEEVKPV